MSTENSTNQLIQIILNDFCPQNYEIEYTVTGSPADIGLTQYNNNFYTRGCSINFNLNSNTLFRYGDLVDGFLFSINNIPTKITIHYKDDRNNKNYTQDLIINREDLTIKRILNKDYALWQIKNYLISLLDPYVTPSIVLYPENNIPEIFPIYGFFRSPLAIRQAIMTGKAKLSQLA